MSDVTQILSRLEQGDTSAAEQLLPLVYTELRKLAADRYWAYARAWLGDALRSDDSR